MSDYDWEGLPTIKDITHNPCMKCGSVECAICSEDFKDAIKKWFDWFDKNNNHHRMQVAENEHIRDWLEHFLNKR